MAGKIELVLTAEFKEAYKKLPQDIKKKVKKQLPVNSGATVLNY